MNISLFNKMQIVVRHFFRRSQENWNDRFEIKNKRNNSVVRKLLLPVIHTIGYQQAQSMCQQPVIWGIPAAERKNRARNDIGKFVAQQESPCFSAVSVTRQV